MATSDKRPCPTCGGMRWDTIKSRPGLTLETYDRQRKCAKCGAVWGTEERWVRQISGPRPSTSQTAFEYLG